MEGLIFYWVIWIFWVIVTFFLNKNNPVRLRTALWLLTCIILSSKQIRIFENNWSFATFFIMVSTYMVVATFPLKRIVYVILSTLIVLMAYVSFLMFELYDPVLLLFKREWMLSILLVYLVFLLHKELKTRVLTLLAGTIHGEIIYSLILRKISLPYTVGALSYLDVVALAAAIIFLWYGFEKAAAYLNHSNGKLKVTSNIRHEKVGD